MKKLEKFIDYANLENDFIYANTVIGVEKWLKRQNFSSERIALQNHLSDFKLEPLMIDGSNLEKLKKIRDTLCSSHEDSIGLLIAPYYFTWNIRRFDEYSNDEFFDVVTYFTSLTYFFENNRLLFNEYRDYHIALNPPEYGRIRSIYEMFNDKLKEIGSQNNECVGLMKLTHLLNPKLFPLIDNPIAKGFELIKGSGDRLDLDKCIFWAQKVSLCLRSFHEDDINAFEEGGVSLVRALDIALMHYRVEPYGKKSSAKNMAHIQSLGFRI